MTRKKEIIIVTVIIIVTIILAVIPSILSSSSNNNSKVEETTSQTSSTSNTISIKLMGELNVPIDSDINIGSYTNNITLDFNIGISYREISDIVYSSYRTKYTIIDTTLSKRYFSDTTIVFESSYKEVLDDEIITTTVDPNLICINTADKDLLKTIYGIGEARANLIISYRELNYISTFDELKSLLGVSDEIIEHIKRQAIL